jgi:hypothetical protein
VVGSSSTRAAPSSFVLFLLLFGMTSYGFIWLINYPDRQNLYLTRSSSSLLRHRRGLDRRGPRGHRENEGGLFRRGRWRALARRGSVPRRSFELRGNDLHEIAEDWGRNLFRCMKPEAIVIPSADHSTFPLIYLQAVEGCGDVVIADMYGYIEDRTLRDLFRGRTPRVPPPLGDAGRSSAT